jgi:hypothetical protein
LKQNMWKIKGRYVEDTEAGKAIWEAEYLYQLNGMKNLGNKKAI